MIRVSIPGRSWEFLSSPLCSYPLWGLLSLLYSGYRGLFPWVYSGRGVKLTTQLHLVSRTGISGAIHPLPQYAFIALFSVKESTGTTLPLPLIFLILFI